MTAANPIAAAEASREPLEALLGLLASDHRSLSSVLDPDAGWRAHVLDSLAGLGWEPLSASRRIADIGAGAGFPGLALAVALPEAEVELIESVSRKCAFMNEAIDRLGLGNAKVRCVRAEDWSRRAAPDGGREQHDVVTARAVGPLALLIELASPLLRDGGRLVAWKGRVEADELAVAASAAPAAAMVAEETVDVAATTGFEHRILCIYRKVGPTPAELPRRTGLARKRPLGRA